MSALARLPRPVRPATGFTLLEMMIAMAVFILLSAAIFGIIASVLESTSTLVDNQNHRDQITALNSFLKKKLGDLPARSTLISYQRGDGEGLVQNGIIFGTDDSALALDAKIQNNGFYTLRLSSFMATPMPNNPASAQRLNFNNYVAAEDPSLVWVPLIHDVQTVSWKFQIFNQTDWFDQWNVTSTNPNVVEFSMQLAGDLQPVTMDFWIKRIDPVSIRIIPPAITNAP